MPHVICFGRALPNIEYEYLHGLDKFALIIDGNFADYFECDIPPLAAYCKWLSHGRLDRAEFKSLQHLRFTDSGLALAFHMGKI